MDPLSPVASFREEIVMAKQAAKKVAEYWEGWQACQIRQTCNYDKDEAGMRDHWAEGFANAVAEQRAGKVWWKSNTIRTALICLTAGIVVLLYGRFSGNGAGNEIMSAGGGMSVGAILSMGLRKMINDSPVHWSGGSQQWYSGQ